MYLHQILLALDVERYDLGHVRLRRGPRLNGGAHAARVDLVHCLGLLLLLGNSLDGQWGRWTVIGDIVMASGSREDSTTAAASGQSTGRQRMAAVLATSALEVTSCACVADVFAALGECLQRQLIGTLDLVLTLQRVLLLLAGHCLHHFHLLAVGQLKGDGD